VVAANDRPIELPEPTRASTWACNQPASSISYNEIFIFRIAGGRIVETWGVVDVFSQMRQLGLIA
jgi:SnoaL-like polyketide cyclase